MMILCPYDRSPHCYKRVEESKPNEATDVRFRERRDRIKCIRRMVASLETKIDDGLQSTPVWSQCGDSALASLGRVSVTAL